ncbi:hypothetical protein CV093_03965 [Oceanobacillus sp. 143]|nr:hypothetical protein CV093_03965 [Oceanobacillus sp. 143]
MKTLDKRTEYDIIYTADMTITKIIQLNQEYLEKYSSYLDEYYVLLASMTESLETLKEFENPNTDEIKNRKKL